MDALVQDDQFELLADLKKLKSRSISSQSPNLTRSTRGLGIRVITYENTEKLSLIWDVLAKKDKSNSAQCDPELFVVHLSEFNRVHFGLDETEPLEITIKDGESVEGGELTVGKDQIIRLGGDQVTIHYNAVHADILEPTGAPIDPACAIFAKVFIEKHEIVLLFTFMISR
jgi:hypothetical protein